MDEDTIAAWEGFEKACEERLGACDSMRRLLSNQEPTVVRLSDGDWHVCEKEHCPYACVDSENRTYFCSLCGLCWGIEFVGGTDPSWTGRSTTTCDPDAISGTPAGGWRPRKDAFAESQRAFKAASELSDKEVSTVHSNQYKPHKTYTFCTLVCLEPTAPGLSGIQVSLHTSDARRSLSLPFVTR